MMFASRTEVPSSITNFGSGRRRVRSPLVLSIVGVLLATTITTVGVSPPAHADARDIPPIVPPFLQLFWGDGRIASSAGYDMVHEYLHTIDSRGSNAAGIGGHWWQESNPSWSRNGTKLAYTFDGIATGDKKGVAIVNADGTGLTEVLQTDMSPGKPTWSPDGKWLALTMYDGTDVAIYKVKTDGTQLTKIVSSDAFAPDWCPGGGSIAVAAVRAPYNSSQIALIFTDGSIMKWLTAPNAEFVEAYSPAWSPDSSKIAFTAKAPDGTYGIWVMNADGSGATQVVAEGGGPEWAPNGALILFSHNLSPYVVPATGGEAMMLPGWTPPPAGIVPRRASGFDWQPVLRTASLEHSTGLVDPSTGVWYLYGYDGVLARSFYYGNPGDYPFMGDWDGDGVETPGLYRQSDGYVYLRNSNDQGPADVNFFFGNPGDVPIAGDFNGDGYDTVSIYRPSNQTFYIINHLGSGDQGLGAADFSYVFGNPGDKPFVGDFDGDGIETVGLHRESTGFVYFRNTHTQGNADNEFFFGDPGDRFIAGDWNDDGNFTPALFRPSDTTMYFRYTNTQGNADNEYIPITTNPAWLPVAGHTGW